MDLDKLIEKLGSEQLSMGPSLRLVVERVKTAGLHKAAEKLFDVPELNAKVAATLLGSALLKHNLKHQKIASGIKALTALEQSGDVNIKSR